MLQSYGYLDFSYVAGERLAVSVDSQISDYYRWFLSKYGITINRPRFPAHISVVRKEEGVDEKRWKDYANRELKQPIKIKFQYSNEVFWDETYYWLAVECPHLEHLRRELGLPSLKEGVTLSPDGRHKFHITIGNVK